MSTEKKKRGIKKPRGSWGAIKPVQKPYSTPKGKHGYTRLGDKNRIEESVDELQQNPPLPG